MPIAPGATARPTIFLPRYQTKAPKTPPNPKNLSPKIRNQPCHMTMRRSRLKRKTRMIKRRSSKTVGGNKTNKLRQLVTIPRPRRRKKRGVTQARSHVSTAIKRAITPTTIPSLQKTSIGLDNLCAGDRWWQGGWD